VSLRVEDNGKGIKENEIVRGSSFGILGMQERTRLLGGAIDITGKPEKGTVIALTIPIAQLRSADRSNGDTP
jgi:signal transduction histidine kinase